MSAGFLALDPIASELVSIATAEYEAAEVAARAHLDRRLAPIKARYCPEGKLSLRQTPDGWVMEVEELEAEEANPVEEQA